MSLSHIENVKKDGGFRVWDLLIYGVIVLVVAVIFIAVFATRNKSELTGVRFYVNNAAVYEYDFTEKSDGYKGIFLSEVVEVTEDNGKILKLKVSAYGGYNVVELDRSGSVKVTGADCSRRADCVHTPAVKDGGGVIFCSPHRFKIVPYDFNPDGGNIII